jgi:hypothetical protein
MDTINQQINLTDKKKPKFVQISIIVAIIIVLNLFSNYAVSLFFKEPNYDSYIKKTQVIENIPNKDACISIGGQWNENVYPTEKGKTKSEGYCDPNYTNSIKFEKDRLSYEKKVFITLIIFGVGLIASSGFLAVQILSVSFAWGGVLSLIIASMRYWSLADSLVKVIILAIALALLIWLAVKKFNK